MFYQMICKNCKLVFNAFILIRLLQTAGVSCLSLQALINLDNDSEELIGLLIDKVDSIIDPQITDSQNATNELAHAILKIGPLISINGTISDGNKGFRMNFNCNLKAMANTAVSETVYNKKSHNIENTSREEVPSALNDSTIKSIINRIESALHCFMVLILNGIITNVVTNIMTEAAMLSNVNFS